MHLDTILRGGRIYTLAGERPVASSIGILGDRIAGFDDELDGCSADTVVELEGRTVVPGFIDAHCHTAFFGLGLSAVDLAGLSDLEAVYRKLNLAVAGGEGSASNDASVETWIRAVNFNHQNCGGQFPDLQRLDAITKDRPLYLRHASGHQAVVNTAALKLIGAFDDGFTDPEGGVVVRDENGAPTGVLQEQAQTLVQDLFTPWPLDMLVAAIDDATRQYASCGITSFTDAGIGGGWIGHSPLEALAFQKAADTGRLHARAQLMPVIDSLIPLVGSAEEPEHDALGLSLGMRSGFGGPMLSLGPTKVFVDGSLLSTTAAVTEDFCGHPGNRGYLLGDRDAMADRVERAYRAGWSLALHAIGDYAIDVAIETIARCQERWGRHDMPNRIEHFGMARPEQVRAVAELGIAVTPQASFIGPLGAQMALLVGPERDQWLYRGRSIVDAGAVLAGSSDSPVADNSVLRAMQSSVDRYPDYTNEVLGGWGPDDEPREALTRDEALRSYTQWGAAATGTLSEKGTLECGKLADLVILEGDPIQDPHFSDQFVTATVLGGAPTFDPTSLFPTPN